MSNLIVADSAVLIGLDRIDHLFVLRRLYEKVLIPPEVERETGLRKPWLIVEEPKNKPLVFSLKLVLDSGEAEAIALASLKNVRVILDDRQARKIARRMNLDIIGTIGILILAKKDGLIDSLMPIIDNLKKNNFFIGDRLKAEALKIAGES